MLIFLSFVKWMSLMIDLIWGFDQNLDFVMGCGCYGCECVSLVILSELEGWMRGEKGLKPMEPENKLAGKPCFAQGVVAASRRRALDAPARVARRGDV